MGYKLITLVILFPLFCVSQSQNLNGISLNGPEGFVRTQDYQWSTENDYIIVTSLKTKLSSEGKTEVLKVPSRASEFIMIKSYVLNENKYNIGYHFGENGNLISVAIVERDIHSYFITCSTNPDIFSGELSDITKQAFKRIEYMNGYMITRILTF